MQEGSFTVEGSYTATNGRFQASPFWRATKVSVGWSLMEYGISLMRLNPSVMGLRAEKISRPSSPFIQRFIVISSLSGIWMVNPAFTSLLVTARFLLYI